MNTTTRLGLSVIDTPAVDTVNNLRQSINNHATILDAQYIESTYAARPAAASKGRVHRSTDTGEIAIDTGTSWESIWGTPSLSRSVLDVGQVGQTRAGRQLSASDVTDCGLSAPVLLCNLSDTADSSGNGLNLTNKGSVPFGVGIEGLAATAARFSGATAQALYRADTGAADPLRIRAGYWGGWSNTAKQLTSQSIVTKRLYATQIAYYAALWYSGVARAAVSVDGTTFSAVNGTRRIDDGRHHFVIATYDGAVLRLYVDGELDGMLAVGGPIFASSAPLNIGAYGADGTTAASEPHYGTVDEVLVGTDVPTLGQIRHLYGVKLSHGLTVQPRRASLRLTRRRRGAALANSDFPSNPARVYNLAAGSYAELNGGTALTASGTPVVIAGPDGQKDSAIGLSGSAFLQADDTGLPSGTADRTYGCFFFSFSLSANQNILGWASNGARLTITNGLLNCDSGADSINTPIVVADGVWRRVGVIETNTPSDGVKRKLFLDGVLVGSSTFLNALTPAGAGGNGLRVGASISGTSTLQGGVARPFVHPGALTPAQLETVFQKTGAALLKTSPKNAGDNVEGLWANSLIFIGDDLEPTDVIDLEVSR